MKLHGGTEENHDELVERLPQAEIATWALRCTKQGADHNTVWGRALYHDVTPYVGFLVCYLTVL